MARLGLEHVASIGSETIEGAEQHGMYVILNIVGISRLTSIYPSVFHWLHVTWYSAVHWMCLMMQESRPRQWGNFSHSSTFVMYELHRN